MNQNLMLFCGINDLLTGFHLAQNQEAGPAMSPVCDFCWDGDLIQV